MAAGAVGRAREAELVGRKKAQEAQKVRTAWVATAAKGASVGYRSLSQRFCFLWVGLYARRVEINRRSAEPGAQSPGTGRRGIGSSVSCGGPAKSAEPAANGAGVGITRGDTRLQTTKPYPFFRSGCTPGGTLRGGGVPTRTRAATSARAPDQPGAFLRGSPPRNQKWAELGRKCAVFKEVHGS